MPRRRENLTPVVDPMDEMRSSRGRVLVDASVDYDDADRNVTSNKPVRFPTTGETLMALRSMIAERTGEPWHVACRLRPLSEEPDARFQVYARLVAGTTEWLGEYDAALDEIDLINIVDELVAMRKDAVDTAIAAKEQRDADGEVTAIPQLVGQSRKVALANGDVIDVQVRNQTPRESASTEDARLLDELGRFEKVILMCEKGDTVFWNGLGYALVPGPNTVPKPIADVYMQSFTATMQAKARMSMVLGEGQQELWRARQLRGY